MEFDSPGTLLEREFDLSLEELDAILEVDVVDSVPPQIINLTDI